MSIDDYRIQIDTRPEPTEEQWDAWRHTVTTHAPDLLDMLFGSRR